MTPPWRRRVGRAVGLLGLVALVTTLWGQGFRPMSTMVPAVYDVANQRLMGIPWVGAQGRHLTVDHIWNAIFVAATEDQNAYLRMKSVQTGTTLPTTCAGGESVFTMQGTGQHCICNELGDGWVCYAGTGGGGSVSAGSIGPTELASTAVAPGVCGDATNVCQSTYDADGRAIAATNIPITVGPTQLAATAVTPGVCGDATNVCQSTYDADGRATLATNVPIVIGSAQVTDGTIGPGDLASTTVTPGICGDATTVCQSTYDADGRATLATGVPITVGSAQITNGTVGPDDLADTTGTPGAFGSATEVATFTRDADGRLTAAANVAITVGAAQITNGTVGPDDLADTTGTPGAFGSSTAVATFTRDADGRLTAAAEVPIDASYMRTLCVTGFDGGTNTDSVNPNVFFTHTLTCTMPSAKLTTNSVLEICTAWNYITSSTGTPIWFEWLANGVEIAKPNGPTTPNNSANRVFHTCIQMLVAGAPGASVATYTTPSGNQVDVTANGSSATAQPVNLNTSGTVAFTQRSKLDADTAGTNSVKQLWMVVKGSGVLP